VTAVRTALARQYPSAIDDRFREGTSMHRLAAPGRQVPAAGATPGIDPEQTFASGSSWRLSG
jgi:hypothetical protein